MIKPEFGDIVEFTDIYKRREKNERRINDISGNSYCVTVKYWNALEKKGSGLYLGLRTISNGVRKYDDDDGFWYSPQEYFTVALVCTGPRSNPIYVKLDTKYTKDES